MARAWPTAWATLLLFAGESKNTGDIMDECSRFYARRRMCLNFMQCSQDDMMG